MKLYNVFSLYVITIDGQKYICEEISKGKVYKEVLTKRKINLNGKMRLQGLSDYYSLFEAFNFSTREALVLTKTDILNKYININIIENKESDLHR